MIRLLAAGSGEPDDASRSIGDPAEPDDLFMLRGQPGQGLVAEVAERGPGIELTQHQAPLDSAGRDVFDPRLDSAQHEHTEDGPLYRNRVLAPICGRVGGPDTWVGPAALDIERDCRRRQHLVCTTPSSLHRHPANRFPLRKVR